MNAHVAVDPLTSTAVAPTASGRPAPNVEDPAQQIAADELKAFIERLERLDEEKRGIQGDIKEVFAEAKGRGFDTKVIRKILAFRRMDHAERQEQEAILDLYLMALGMA